MKKFLFIIAIFLLYTTSAFAADLSIVAPPNIRDNKTFVISINLNTSGVLINSMDITLSYPKDIVTFKGYKEEGSIKKSWYLPPTDASGSIHFIGIIPGGVDGVYDPDKIGLQSLPIIELIFSAKNDGKGEFAITRSDILQNDGLGTSLPHEVKNAVIEVSRTQDFIEEAPLETGTKNLNPPELFTIGYIPAGLFSKTPSMIIFSTTDKESGVEKYQLLAGSDSWKDVTSPLPIQKSLLKKDVVIRALDFDGNTREAQVEIPGLVSTTQLFLIILLGVICYFMYFVVKRKR